MKNCSWEDIALTAMSKAWDFSRDIYHYKGHGFNLAMLINNVLFLCEPFSSRRLFLHHTKVILTG